MTVDIFFIINSKFQMYNELVNGYKWYEKTHQYSTIASTTLQHNSLKRSYFSTSNKRRRLLTGAHTGRMLHYFSFLQILSLLNFSSS